MAKPADQLHPTQPHEIAALRSDVLHRIEELAPMLRRLCEIDQGIPASQECFEHLCDLAHSLISKIGEEPVTLEEAETLLQRLEASDDWVSAASITARLESLDSGQ